MRTTIHQLLANENLNFLLTNRVPRYALTRFIGWFSKIERPWVRGPSIAIWKFFSDLDLGDAKKRHFKSMHECFTRELKEGARVVDARTAVLTCPSDGIVGASGRIARGQLMQIKGAPYLLQELIPDSSLVDLYEGGTYVTLRLTSSMYHRFHAPCTGTVEQVQYIFGDTWNVNPIALKRVEKLFCKNERAVIRMRMPCGAPILLVPVAAILVASIRLHFLNVLLHLKYPGPNLIQCDQAFAKGQEMGWFQHGSTILVFAPRGFSLCEGIEEGRVVSMGQGLMLQPLTSGDASRVP